MELRHLRYFVAVAEELHFGRAAQRLHMAQPPLSQQIRQLETEIGVTLLARTNRHVELTPAGEIFLREAHDILDSIERAVRHAQRASLGEWGWLGIGFVGSATYDILPKVTRRFRESYPEVELVLRELTGEEQELAMRDKRIHVGFVRNLAPDAGIVQEKLLEEPLMLAMPSSHPMAQRQSIALSEMANEPFIFFRRSSPSSYGVHLTQICQEAGFTPKVVQRAGEIQTAIGLVCAGLGVTIVPASTQNFQREGVIYMPLSAPTPTIGLKVAYRKEDESPLLQHFLEIAHGVVKGE